MKGIFAFIMAVVLAPAIAFASSWSLEDLNATIDQTNFVVNRGCSGTLISVEERLILTNYHCVDGLITLVEREEASPDGFVRKVRIRRYADVVVDQHGYRGHDKVSSLSYVAEIVAEDKKRDLAILRIKSNIPHKTASKLLPDDKVVLRGERVWAVGNPAGYDATVTSGVVSNLNRTFEFPWTDNERLPMIQFSGGITGGNSGGSLYNSEGFLIGVPAARHRDVEFIGLAIPISVVKKFMAENCLAQVFDAGFDRAACEAQRKKK